MSSHPPVQIGKTGKMGIANSRFSPAAMSPALWLDAADTHTIIETAGAVSQWSDKSGNGYHAAQNTVSNQPETGTRTLNGKNALYFSGGSDAGHFLSIDDPVIDLTTDNFTILSVAHADAGNSYDDPWSWSAGGSSPLRLEDTGSGNYKIYPSVFISPGITLGNPESPNIVSVRANGVSTRDARYNGALGTSGSGDTLSAATNFNIGARYSYGYNAFAGSLAEIIIFARSLSDTELNRAGRYLSKKWGVAWVDI